MEYLKKIKNESKSYYSNRETGQVDAMKVGWKNTEAQQVRFQQLFREIELKDNQSLVDLGCGLGDLSHFVRNKYLNKKISYLGLDLFEDMIKQASLKYQQENFLVIKDNSEIPVSDYVVASGIFNLKHSLSDKEWLEYIKDTLVEMYKKCNIAVAVNFLTSFSDKEFMRDELYYSSPGEITEFCLKNLSKNCIIYHDYGLYDFTIIIKK